MNYITFTKELKNFPAFSLKDINKLSGKVYYHRLIDWQKKGYIRRIANGIFTFADESMDEMYLFYLANRIYEPSYISLESALAHYGFIPEAVYHITSVSTKKTMEFQQENLRFSYRSISKRLFFGYKLIDWRNVAVKMAEPEKVILDYFYLNPELSTLDHIEEMRFNAAEIREKINFPKMENYLSIYRNNALSKRINIFKEWLNNA